jgi:hypothetical protein
MAKAAAGNGGAAVAEATATVYCQGSNSQAEAWSESVAEAVRRDQRTGCLILDRAVARARAKCQDGVAKAAASSKTTSTLLGGCGLGWGGGGGGGGGGPWAPPYMPSGPVPRPSRPSAMDSMENDPFFADFFNENRRGRRRALAA